MGDTYRVRFETLMANYEYHKKMAEILTDHLDYVENPHNRRKIMNRRSYHRRQARTYFNKAHRCWDTCGKEE